VPDENILQYLFKLHCNILPSMPYLPSGLFPSGFPTKTLLIYLLPNTYYMPCPSHPPWFDHLNNIWLDVRVPNSSQAIVHESSLTSLEVTLLPATFYGPWLDLKRLPNALCVASTWLKLLLSTSRRYVWGREGIAPFIIKFGTRWRWEVNFTSRALCPHEMNPS
jgi:hypothetical protein